MPEPYLIGTLATLGMRGIAKIMSRRSLANYQANYLFVRWVEKQLHKTVQALLANSSAVASELVRECGQPAKVGIIHSGIAMPATTRPDRRASLRHELGIPAQAFTLVVIANLIPYKGHRELIEALSLVRGRLGGPWRLMLIGRDDGIGASLKQMATAAGLADHMLWLDERPDAQALLDAADLAVLPSHEEGFSNSLLEKMAHGLAVVATAVGGNLDAVVDGKTGRLVPPKNPKVLGEAIADLYGDAALRARLGAAARRRVEQLFTIDACIKRYLNLYQGAGMLNSLPVAQIIDPTHLLQEHAIGSMP